MNDEMTEHPGSEHRPIDDDELVDEPVGQPPHDLPGGGPDNRPRTHVGEATARRDDAERRRREMEE